MKKSKENKQLFLGTKKMSRLTKEQLEIFVNDSDIYNDFMDIFHSHSYERLYNNEEYDDILGV